MKITVAEKSSILTAIRQTVNEDNPARQELLKILNNAEVEPIPGVEKSTDLAALATRLGLRHDWHEPDNSEVSARVIGDYLDNAMGSTATDNHGEYNVIITHDGVDVAVINLATLLAMAAGTFSEE